MTDESNSSEKKIIVDEDWKNQVDRERESLRQQVQSAEVGDPPVNEKLPPASLTYLASTFYFQGAIALGLLPHPVSGKSEMNLGQARHIIDTLDILQKKTEGNRTPEESEEIEAILHQLRLTYVQLLQSSKGGEEGVKTEV